MEASHEAEFVIGPNEDSMHSSPGRDCNSNNVAVEDGAVQEAVHQDVFEGERNAPEPAEPTPQERILAFKDDVESLRTRPRSEIIPNTIPERQIFQRVNAMIRDCGLAAQRKAQELIGLTSLSNRTRRVCQLIMSHEIVSTNGTQFTWKLSVRAVSPDSSTISISDFAKRVFFETENNVEVGEWSASKIAGFHPVDECVITRTSPLPTIARIHICLDADPPIFRLHQKLATLLGLEHETMLGIVARVMSYVKQHSLQDADDLRYINCDQELHDILGVARIAVCHVQKLIEKHIDVCEAFVVPYEVGTKSGAKVYESIIDTHRDSNFTPLSVPQYSEDVFDAETTDVLRKINTSRSRHQFFSRLAESPQEFLAEYLESQANDLRILQQGGGLSHASREESTRARLWQQPWVEDAVASYVIRSFK